MNSTTRRISFIGIVFMITLSYTSIRKINTIIEKQQNIQYHTFPLLSKEQLRRCYPNNAAKVFQKLQKQLHDNNEQTIFMLQQQQKVLLQNSRNSQPIPILTLRRQYQVEEFLEGPGLLKRYEKKSAACKFVDIPGLSDHFPHTMQQLYRCFSWYVANPMKDYYLISASKSRHPYIVGFLDILRDVFNVSTVLYRNQLPVVRSIVQYGYDHIYDENDNITDITTTINKYNTNFSTKLNIGYQMTSPHDAKYIRDTVLDYYETKHSFNFKNYIPLLPHKPLPQKTQLLESGIIRNTVSSAMTGCNLNSHHDHHDDNQDNSNKPLLLTRLPRITILNRKTVSGRHIVDVEQIQYVLSTINYEALNIYQSDSNIRKYPTSHIKIIDSLDDYKIMKQILLFASSDIIISSHGAQLTNIPYLADCGVVMELFPYGYYDPEFYSTLASVSGKLYDSVYVGGNDMYNETLLYMEDMTSREVARSFDICPTSNYLLMEQIQQSVIQKIKEWKQCCHSLSEEKTDDSSLSFLPSIQISREKLKRNQNSITTDITVDDNA